MLAYFVRIKTWFSKIDNACLLFAEEEVILFLVSEALG